MASIKNNELIPADELKAWSEGTKNINDLDAAILKLASSIAVLHDNFKKGGNYKDLINDIDAYTAKEKECSTLLQKRAKEADKIAEMEAKITAAYSNEAKHVALLAQNVKDLQKANKLEVKGRMAEAEYLRNISEQRAIIAGKVKELGRLESEGLYEQAAALRDVIEQELKLLGVETERSSKLDNGIELTDEEREAVERSNQAFAERAKTLSDAAVYEREEKTAIEESAESVKSYATTQDAAQSAFDTLTESIQMQTQSLIEMKLERDQVREQMKGLTKDYQDGNVAHDSYILRTAELMALERDLSTAIDTTAAKIKYETQIATTAVGSYENLTAQYSLMKIEINALGEAEGDNIEKKRALEAQAKSLYETMDQLQRATGKNQLNVGNYDSAVTDLTKTVSLLDPKLGMIVRKVQNVTAFKKTWITINNQLTKSLNISAKAANMLQIALVGLVVGGIYLAVKAISGYIAKQKELRAEQEAVHLEGTKNAQKEMTTLNLLYKAAQNTSNSLKDRTTAAKELQKLYPDYLGNMSQESILAGNAAKSYDELQKAILRKAVAQAAADKIAKIEIARAEELSEINKGPGVWAMGMLAFAKATGIAKVETAALGYAADSALTRQADAVTKVNNKYDEQRAIYEKLIDVQDLIKEQENKGGDSKVIDRLKAEQKAISDYALFQIQVEATKQKEIADDDKNFYQTRIQALESFLSTQENLLRSSAEADKAIMRQRLKDGEITKENANHTILLIDAKLQEELRKITRGGEELRLGITKDYANKQTDAMVKVVALRTAMTTEAESVELRELAKSYSDKEIGREEYEKRMLEITRKYAEQRAQMEIDMMKEQLDKLPLDAEQREQLQLQLAKAEIDLEKKKNDDITKDYEDAVKEREEIQKRYVDFSKQMAEELMNFASTLMSAQTDRELAEIEKRQEALRADYDERIAEIERLEESGAISVKDANAKKALAEQQLRDEEKKLEDERVAAQIKQAKFDKAMNIMKIIVSTAAAVMNVAPVIPLMVMMGVLGAVQLATAIAAPIPQYAEGTDSHRGGLAWVGDGGRPEMMIANGNIYKTPAIPTLVDLPKGAQVLPDWNAAMMAMAFTPIHKYPSDVREGSPVVNVDFRKMETLQEKGNSELSRFMRSYNAEKKNQQFYAFANNKKRKLHY